MSNQHAKNNHLFCFLSFSSNFVIRLTVFQGCANCTEKKKTETDDNVLRKEEVSLMDIGCSVCNRNLGAFWQKKIICRSVRQEDHHHHHHQAGESVGLRHWIFGVTKLGMQCWESIEMQRLTSLTILGPYQHDNIQWSTNLTSKKNFIVKTDRTSTI